MNPRTGGAFRSFGTSRVEVALEQSDRTAAVSLKASTTGPSRPLRATLPPSLNNFVEHFIDQSGIVSWRFFSASRLLICRGFSPLGKRIPTPTKRQPVRHPGEMGKQVYVAVYDQLGATACRILVPGYSEVYPVEDLIWDNTNKACCSGADILNPCPDDDALAALPDRLENNELDDYSTSPP
jgi:ribosomal protein S12 methylthiotransferase accessory factor